MDTCNFTRAFARAFFISHASGEVLTFARRMPNGMPVLVTNDFPPQHGGIQRCMSRIAQELASRNERIVVVAPRTEGSAAFDEVQHFRISRYPGRERITQFATMTLWLARASLMTKDRYTVASMWFPGGLAALLLPRALRGRLGVLAHGSEIAPQRGGLRRRVMRYVFERADVIIANSSFTRDLLVKAGVRQNVSVVHLGIDDSPAPRARAADPTLLSVGRLIPRKGFDRVIEALPRVLQRFPAARYEIVGAGPQRAELEALAARCGVSDHIAFLGAVDDARMRQAYARAWCFVLPVRANGSDVEGFGLVYLEAAIASLPTVGGRGSGAEDAIAAGDTGLLVDGTSADAVGDAIIALFGDPVAAAMMGLRGRERALRDFNWKKTAAQIAALMNGTSTADGTVLPMKLS
jgi:phosphatidylinositol alpha-1,6-mannosyltransferase